MKKLMILIASISIGASAVAENLEPWEQELQNYEQNLTEHYSLVVTFKMARHATTAVTACGVSVAAVAASFVADTLPVSGALSETLANMTNMEYSTQDYDALLSLEALLALGRGTSGGLAVATAETVELFFFYLSGNLDADKYQGTQKVYASSIATLNALFADKSLCMMSMSKMILAAKELGNRYDALVGRTLISSEDDSSAIQQLLMH